MIRKLNLKKKQNATAPGTKKRTRDNNPPSNHRQSRRPRPPPPPPPPPQRLCAPGSRASPPPWSLPRETGQSTSVNYLDWYSRCVNFGIIYLMGVEVRYEGDHKPLTWFKTQNNLSPRQDGWKRWNRLIVPSNMFHARTWWCRMRFHVGQIRTSSISLPF